MSRMQGGHYEVEITFEIIRPHPVPSLASIIERSEQLLPEGSVVRSVTRGSAHEEHGGLDVTLHSASPAMALRDVARAMGLVATEEDETLQDLVRATVTRVPAVGG